MTAWKELEQQIMQCRRCPRLVEHCQHIANVKRKAYLDDEYWGKPVPNFGRAPAPLLIVGLAPGAHGANRTGRMFTGDRSGVWLYRALHKAGFCNQVDASDRDDGLKLKRCAITNICHCAPPANKPNAEEIGNCSGFLDQTIELCRPRVFLALGSMAWNALTSYAIQNDWLAAPRPKFGHAVKIQLQQICRQDRWLIGCYHPSQQNTFTGRLTEPMLDSLMSQVSDLVGR